MVLKNIMAKKKIIKKEKQKSVRTMTAELNIIVAKNPKTLQIGRQVDDNIEINRIVTHDGKIPKHLVDEGWTIYREEFETEHNSEFHEINNIELKKIENRKGSIVKIFKNVYRLSLDDYKIQKKDIVSIISFDKRKEILPDYKIQNAMLGIYHNSEKRLEKYLEIVQRFIDISNKTQKDIDTAKSHEKVFKIVKDLSFSKNE